MHYAILVIILISMPLMLLFGCQRALIYHPRPYAPEQLTPALKAVKRLEFNSGLGNRTAYYYVPGPGFDRPPERLWVLFNGNGALALDWLYTLERIQDPKSGYLLIEYPGYGESAGRATRAGIHATACMAFDALADQAGFDRDALLRNVNVCGFSLGTATGLEFATAFPVRRVVLIAPFTSLVEMARRTVGWPLCNLAVDRYDSRARLGELLTRPDPPEISILHGDADGVIPVTMGRELAGMSPKIDYQEIRGAGHFLDQIGEGRIAKRMNAASQ